MFFWMSARRAVQFASGGRTRGTIKLAFALLGGALLVAANPDARASEVVVGSAAEFVAALERARPGEQIQLQSGEYLIEKTLQVPDGFTVRVGDRMRLDSEGTAAGLDDSAVATLRGGEDPTTGRPATVMRR